MTKEQAAGVFEHYIRIALMRSGLRITPEIDAELREAREAFEDRDERIRDVLKRGRR
jgi:hypothetical protein